MAFRDRFARMRARLKHCNIFVAAFVLALVGMWDELKPLIQDLLSNYISAQNVGVVITALSILAMFVRAGMAMAPTKDDEEQH